MSLQKDDCVPCATESVEVVILTHALSNKLTFPVFFFSWSSDIKKKCANMENEQKS